jgi:hypothetical protein
MTREEARALMQERLKNKNLQKHVLAVAAVMKRLARRLGAEEAVWELAGLLHDLDYEETLQDPDRHGLLSAQWLRERGVAEEIVNAVLAHAGKAPRDVPINQAAYCADPVTGLLVACALIHPEKKLAPLDVPFVQNRFKEKRFAAGANRERIQACAALGLSLEEFLGLSLAAMQEIAGELGL